MKALNLQKTANEKFLTSTLTHDRPFWHLAPSSPVLAAPALLVGPLVVPESPDTLVHRRVQALRSQVVGVITLRHCLRYVPRMVATVRRRIDRAMCTTTTAVELKRQGLRGISRMNGVSLFALLNHGLEKVARVGFQGHIN